MNKHQAVTANIFQRGDAFGNQHSVSVPAFSTVDQNALRKPRRKHICNTLGGICPTGI